MTTTKEHDQYNIPAIEHVVALKEKEVHAQYVPLVEALEGLFSNKHLNLEDAVYQVKERELQGWDGASVHQWIKAVKAAQEALKETE